MPYSSESVDAELFHEYNGVKVYHTYRNDDIQEGVMLYWYTTDECGSVDGAEAFDIRELASNPKISVEAYILKLNWENEADRKKILELAIDARLV